MKRTDVYNLIAYQPPLSDVHGTEPRVLICQSVHGLLFLVYLCLQSCKCKVAVYVWVSVSPQQTHFSIVYIHTRVFSL